MSRAQTAAFDPVFWVHHSNVDRLWTVWDCLPNRVWGSLPDKAWLGEKPWWFVDADGSVKNLPRLSYINARALGITFVSDNPSCRPLSSTPLAGSPIASRQVQFAAVREAPVVGEGPGLALSATTPLTIQVSLITDRMIGNLTATELLSAGSSRHPVLLKVKGIDYESPPSVGFEVYVNLPAEARPNRSSPHYVGNLNLFGIEHVRHLHGGESKQLFDITEISRAPGFDKNEIRVTIVPFDLLEPKPGVARLQRSGNAKVDKLEVLVID
jgi:hypothetical protein